VQLAPDTPASTMFSEVLQADNEVLFRHGLFNAVGNAILLLLLGLLYGVWKLLEDFRSPMLWALLVSLALRDVKVALVRYWTEKLERHTVVGLGITPVVSCWRALQAVMRCVNQLMGITGGDIALDAFLDDGGVGSSGVGLALDSRRQLSATRPISGSGSGDVQTQGMTPRRLTRFQPSPSTCTSNPERPTQAAATTAAGDCLSTVYPRTPPAAATTSSTLASTFHFQWLIAAGIALEGWSVISRDWVLTRSVVALAAVAVAAAVAAAAAAAITYWYLFTREDAYGNRQQQGSQQQQQGRKQYAVGAHSQQGVRGRRVVWATSQLNWCKEKYVAFDLALRAALISSLHVVIAATLISGGIVLVAVIVAFFTVNIAAESSSAMAAAHRSVLERSRSQEGVLQQAVESGSAAWEDAVAAHWPAALMWAQSHVHRVAPGANVTELWVSMQHIYAYVHEAAGKAPDDAKEGGGGVRRWAVVLKEAGELLSAGDLTGAFVHLGELGSELVAGGVSLNPKPLTLNPKP